MLKYTNRRIVELRDWDSLVTETYGKPYQFQQQGGCKSRGIYAFSIPNEWGVEDYENDSIPEEVNGEEMGVSFKAWLERDPNDHKFNHEYEKNLFWGRNFYPNVDMIIDDLHKKGLLEEGDYIINIDW